MFEHSVKVPRLYKISAKISKQCVEGGESIKNLLYKPKTKRLHPNLKAIYALVSVVVARNSQLDMILKKSQLLKKECRFDPWLAKILICELIWGKKQIKGESTPVKTILAYEQIIKAHLSDMSIDENEEKQVKPRYVRVNTIISSVKDVIKSFKNDGWRLVNLIDKTNYNAYLEKIKNLKTDEFIEDIHIPSLLVFPAKTEFYNHEAYKNGTLILQDKASCLPVHILQPNPGSTVLDMCAAPGMKTLHAAALMQNQGTLYAVERDTDRFSVLKQMIENAGINCVKFINNDVLNVTESECSNVEYILVDPSCSGSGIHNSNHDTNLKQRLSKLAAFQAMVLKHALLNFRNAKRVVYSTCSIYPEENEDVVRQVLETCSNFKLVPVSNLIQNWFNFGSSDFGEIGRQCLYTKPNEDLTIGFFIAVFERIEKGEKNPFFNSKLINLHKKQRKRKLE